MGPGFQGASEGLRSEVPRAGAVQQVPSQVIYVTRAFDSRGPQDRQHN